MLSSAPAAFLPRAEPVRWSGDHAALPFDDATATTRMADYVARDDARRSAAGGAPGLVEARPAPGAAAVGAPKTFWAQLRAHVGTATAAIRLGAALVVRKLQDALLYFRQPTALERPDTVWSATAADYRHILRRVLDAVPGDPEAPAIAKSFLADASRDHHFYISDRDLVQVQKLSPEHRLSGPGLNPAKNPAFLQRASALFAEALAGNLAATRPLSDCMSQFSPNLGQLSHAGLGHIHSRGSSYLVIPKRDAPGRFQWVRAEAADDDAKTLRVTVTRRFVHDRIQIAPHRPGADLTAIFSADTTRHDRRGRLVEDMSLRFLVVGGTQQPPTLTGFDLAIHGHVDGLFGRSYPFAHRLTPA